MARPTGLNPKQTRFVAEYLVDLNGTQAVIRAGYSAKGAHVTAIRFLRDPTIAAAVAAGKAEQLADMKLTASRVLEEIRRLAFSDARGFWDESGNLKPIKDLTAEQGSVLSSFEAIIKNAKAGDNQTDTIHKIRLWDKTRALELLAKHFKLLTDVHEHRFSLEDMIAGSMVLPKPEEP